VKTYPLTPEQKEERKCRIAAAKALGWKGPWRFGNDHLHGTPPNGKRTCVDGDHVPEKETELAGELAELRNAIVTFVKESEWGAKCWKEQPHIKRLFDIAKAVSAQ